MIIFYIFRIFIITKSKTYNIAQNLKKTSLTPVPFTSVYIKLEFYQSKINFSSDGSIPNKFKKE